MQHLTFLNTGLAVAVPSRPQFRVRHLELAVHVQGNVVGGHVLRKEPPASVAQNEGQAVAPVPVLQGLVLIIAHVGAQLAEDQYVKVTITVHVRNAG